MPIKLIIVDGIPGSGKSTTGSMLQARLEELRIPSRFIHELEDHHPLRIYDRQFTSFKIEEEADWFAAKVKQLFHDFAADRVDRDEIAIVDSYVFQDTLAFAYNMGMDRQRLMLLTESIQSSLQVLNPILIYYVQKNVEQHWRWICEIRGTAFAHDRCGLYTDEDFIRAGEFWTSTQECMLSIVEQWEIPKVIIPNKDYLWEEYRERISEFVEGFVRRPGN